MALPAPGFVAHQATVVGVSAAQCQRLVAALEGERKAAGAVADVDFRLPLTSVELSALLGAKSFARLLALFGGRADEIVVRRMAAAGRCIPFHTDSSLRVMQVPLNDDSTYGGGRLVFVAPGGRLVAPPRPAGSATIHDNQIVHGVTTMTHGVRYGLYFLQTC